MTTSLFTSLFLHLLYPPFFYTFLFYLYDDHCHLHSFPTRRSSDLSGSGCFSWEACRSDVQEANSRHTANNTDRKSTRLNSSHVSMSYAVFCLKKKIL